MSRYLVKIFTPQELNHSSYIQTGLFELESEQWINTRVILSLTARRGLLKIENGKLTETNQPHPKTSFYELVDTHTSKRIRFATDLYDASFSFSKFALEHCDYIFKRNFERANIDKLPSAYSGKIKPFGLSFVVLSECRKGRFQLFLSLFLNNLLISVKPDRNFFKRLYNSVKEQTAHWKFISKARLLGEFQKYTQTEEYNNKILFQTRCFPHETAEDTLLIHRQRQRIIHELRKEFGSTFIGGIIPSPLALQNYGDAISNLPSDPASYLKVVKETTYVIYTRGLLHSPAWKLAEYLSQGKVIIAEKLTAELPVPLTHRKEVLFFNDESEIPDLIREAMNDPELSDQLSKNARAYFEKYVHPKQNMKRILDFLIKELQHA